jgi:ATP-dependent Clp protease protease subunit
MMYVVKLLLVLFARINALSSQGNAMRKSTEKSDSVAWFTLSGDVNSDMVHRVFDAVSLMMDERITSAHMLIQSNGGYVSDGICLYNLLSKLPIKFIMYNAGAVASIAVTLYLAGQERYASQTARFMLHKSHATASPGARPDALKIIVDGLRADDLRTEQILREHVNLDEEHWRVHTYSDLHLTAQEALAVGLIDAVADFTLPAGCRIINI